MSTNFLSQRPVLLYGISCSHQIVNALTCRSHTHCLASLDLALRAYFATPSSALKQSANCLLCLFEACSVRSLRFVVLWKVWKQVLHLTVWAAVFYSRSVCEFREDRLGAKDAPAKRVVRISTATWPPWDRRRPYGRASAVLYSLVSVALLACTGHGRTLLRCPWC